MKTLIVIVGATASGKTALSVRLAQELNTEIISADGRQFFSEMQIGTARPTTEEMQEVQHHFVASRSIHDELYSVGTYEREVLAMLEQLFEHHETVIMVGGSGLYVKAVCEGMDEMPAIPLELRGQLMQQFETEGIEPLLKKLEMLDHEYFMQVDKANHQRVIRALEMCIATGKTYSSFRVRQQTKRPFNIIKIGISMPREVLYGRINSRVEEMVKQGLEEEARALYPFRNLNALQTVGYSEWFEHQDGRMTREEAIERIKQNTRRYAKKQLTWFTKDTSIHWFTPAQFPELKEWLVAQLHAQ